MPRKFTTEQFIEKAHLKHNYKYDYSLTNYVGAGYIVIIICSIHGQFEQVAHYHLSGNGCQKCNPVSLIGLDNLNILIEYRQYPINIKGKKFKADGYDPNTNTIYEYYGDFWHGNPKVFCSSDINDAIKVTFGELYQKTLKREQLIKKAKYNLVVKWETE